MSNLYNLKRINTDSGNIFDKTKPYTFLVGAGISMDPPSSLPSASEIVSCILKEILIGVPDRLVKNLLSDKNLRYEMIIEELIKIDPDLKFLDYLELVTQPNLLHYFIAQCILHGYYATTTNFDYLIEHAMYNLLPEEKHEMFVTIANQSYYRTFYDAFTGKEEEVYYLLKLHGAKKLLRRKADKNEFLNIQESLNTTMSSFNRSKGLGSVFGVEEYKNKLVHAILHNRVLVVMGYSAGDNLDIVPIIRSEKSIQSIIWIEHASVIPPEIYQLYNGYGDPKSRELQEDNPTLGLLFDIFKQTGKAIFYIRGNTASIVKDFLWERLFDSISIPEELKDNNSFTQDVPVFSDYIKGKFRGLHLIGRLFFALILSLDLRNFNDALAIINKGSQIAEENAFREALYPFEEKRAEVFLIKGERDMALKMFMEIKEEYEEILLNQSDRNAQLWNKKSDYDAFLTQKREKLAWALMKTSETLFEDCFFEKALYPLVKAEELFIQNNSKNGLAWHANTLGKINIYVGKYDVAEKAIENALLYNSANGDLGLKTDILKNQSKLYVAKGLYEKALEKIDLCIETCKILNDPFGITEALTIKADIIEKVGTRKEAVVIINEAHETLRQIDYPKGNILVTNVSARIIKDTSLLHKTSRAVIHGNIELCEKIHFSIGLREALLTAINISSKSKLSGEVEFYGTKAFNFNDKISDPIGRTRIKSQLAKAYYEINSIQFKDHIEKYLKLATTYNRKLQQEVDLSSNLLLYGKFCIDQQRFDEANQKLSESLEIRKNLEFRKGEAEIFRAFGNLHFQMEEYEKSLEYYSKAMEIYTEVKDDLIVKDLQKIVHQVKENLS
ncbi:MAG: tetratricopeptide repeat protein [Promethearchaeota archaeon]|nr:MAG: tetratricopeptide repeat protein [Candidatus Lokiarchaeota archaeon]